ncbi:MAG: class I SAM-dependent methyltransferase [Synergistaceae bacterium]|jgi:SAM-dependent methyltransferase|nr:class I SAM-dependent methyltransferase [Synergistaceae bacterium]
MDYKWDRRAEEERYCAIWRGRPPNGVVDSSAFWDRRAEEWEHELRDNRVRKARGERRVRSTVEFLQGHGLLNGEGEVIDIGCGLGRFVVAFSKAAGHVTGLDISPHMIECSAQLAASQRIKNVSFETCDFAEVDIDKNNWRSRFDLVFASITPALNSLADLEKMIAMSRAYCFSSNSVNAHEPVTEDLLKDLFKIDLSLHWNGRQFYAMFNLLWLRGYFPLVTIFKESSEERVRPNRSLAVRIAEKYLHGAAEADLEKINDWLVKRTDSDGLLIFPTCRWYAWMLWDVRDQRERKY